MVTDLIGGQVDWGVLALPSVQQHLKTGALRPIGVGNAARVAVAARRSRRWSSRACRTI